MSELKFRKVNALPGTFDPDTIYLVKSPDPSYAEIHVSNSTGSAVKRLPTKQDVLNLIATEGGGSGDFDGLTTLLVTETPYELVPGALHVILTDDIAVELVLPAIISQDSVFAVVNATNRVDHSINRNGHLINRVSQNIDTIDLLNTPITFKYLGVTYGVIGIASLQGIIAGNTLTGDASALFDLNADNLASGTVPLARLGSGTPDNTKFLRGDNTWQVPVANSLVATQNIAGSFSSSVTGTYVGTFTGLPITGYSNASATADNRSLLWRHNSDGSFGLYLSDDSLNSFSNALLVTRNANVVTEFKFVSNVFTVEAQFDFAKNYTEKETTVTATASTTINCSLGNVFSVTMNASIATLTFSNVPVSGKIYSLTLFLTQDATGGRSVTWPASVRWPGGTAPTLSAANKVDIVTLITRNGGTTWFASVSGQNYSS